MHIVIQSKVWITMKEHYYSMLLVEPVKRESIREILDIKSAELNVVYSS